MEEPSLCTLASSTRVVDIRYLMIIIEVALADKSHLLTLSSSQDSMVDFYGSTFSGVLHAQLRHSPRARRARRLAKASSIGYPRLRARLTTTWEVWLRDQQASLIFSGSVSLSVWKMILCKATSRAK